jgi:trehalose synthase-fused probable maltokinase
VSARTKLEGSFNILLEIGKGDRNMITVRDNWKAVFEGDGRRELEETLPAFLLAARWYGAKAKTIRSTRLADVLQQQGKDEGFMVVALVEVAYAEGGADTYALPITASFGSEADRIARDHPQAVISSLTVIQVQTELHGILYDAVWHKACASSLLTSMGRSAEFRGSSGTLVGSATELFDEAALSASSASSSVLKGEQSNTSVKFGDAFMMKLYRRVEPGINPELEVGRTLTARHFPHSPALVGALEYVREGAEPMTLALTQRFVANDGNAWDFTLAQLSHYLDGVVANKGRGKPSAKKAQEQGTQASATSDVLFRYRDAASLLGRRTGELHLALGQPSNTADFAPEICSSRYAESRVQAMHEAATRALALLRRRFSSLPGNDRQPATAVLEQEPILLDRLAALARHPVSAQRIRCHGDYHLGQVLYTGSDFVIIDFEGEPAKPLGERRAKLLPLADLAGMIRSFHYAAHVVLRSAPSRHPAEPALPDLVPWVEQWYHTARKAFLRGYRTVAGEADFSPRSRQEFNRLLDVYVLDKALYELAYELNNRPDWVGLPLTGILELTAAPSGEAMDQDETAREKARPHSAESARDEVNP